MGERGFVLTPTYRVVAGRAEVHLHGVLEMGEPALLVDDRFPPSFFVPAPPPPVAHRSAASRPAAGAGADAARPLGPAPRARAPPPAPSPGEPGAGVEVARPGDAPPLRTRLHAAGVDYLEADVRFAQRYL